MDQLAGPAMSVKTRGFSDIAGLVQSFGPFRNGAFILATDGNKVRLLNTLFFVRRDDGQTGEIEAWDLVSIRRVASNRLPTTLSTGINPYDSPSVRGRLFV